MYWNAKALRFLYILKKRPRFCKKRFCLLDFIFRNILISSILSTEFFRIGFPDFCTEPKFFLYHKSQHKFSCSIVGYLKFPWKIYEFWAELLIGLLAIELSRVFWLCPPKKHSLNITQCILQLFQHMLPNLNC